jgi:Nup133 N terminal like
MDEPFLSGAESSAADFDALVEANRALVNQLHRDERTPSLMEQLADPNGAPSHSYFAEPHTPDLWGAQVGARRSLCSAVLQRDLQVHCCDILAANMIAISDSCCWQTMQCGTRELNFLRCLLRTLCSQQPQCAIAIAHSATLTAHDCTLLQVEYRGVVPVPPQLTHAASRVECMSLSGLLPEIHHAWLTVDNHLYLWDYSSEGGDVKEVSMLSVQSLLLQFTTDLRL